MDCREMRIQIYSEQGRGPVRVGRCEYSLDLVRGRTRMDVGEVSDNNRGCFTE